MPFPVYDSTACMKVSAEKTETVMKKIQDLVVRNSQPKKATNGHQAFRLQQVVFLFIKVIEVAIFQDVLLALFYFGRDSY